MPPGQTGQSLGVAGFVTDRYLVVQIYYDANHKFAPGAAAGV